LNQEAIPIWHKDKTIPSDIDGVILPGGFSYGDYLRSGAIARFSPVMQAVVDYANAGGLVVGICNGFQILCESHLLPGALLHNQNQQFICKNVFIKPEQFSSAMTSGLRERAYKIPIAHGEGRYYADAETLAKLNRSKQIIFRYCDANGDVVADSNYNGSTESIAGIVNERGNVFGIMPHPERASEEILGNTDGKLILNSLIAHATRDALQPVNT
jgi:phosphoribosylformylglycinamidine synthase I